MNAVEKSTYLSCQSKADYITCSRLWLRQFRQSRLFRTWCFHLPTLTWHRARSYHRRSTAYSVMWHATRDESRRPCRLPVLNFELQVSRSGKFLSDAVVDQKCSGRIQWKEGKSLGTISMVLDKLDMEAYSMLRRAGQTPLHPSLWS